MLSNQLIGRIAFHTEHHMLAGLYYQEKSKWRMIAQSVKLLHHSPSLALELTLRGVLQPRVTTQFARPFIVLAQPLSRQFFSFPVVVLVYSLHLSNQALPFGSQPRHLFP